MTDIRRPWVVAEAESWLETPFHHEARVKGAGVDCGQLLIAVYSKFGFMPDLKVPHYSSDFALHRSEEWYRNIVETYAQVVEVPRPGDLVLFKYGRSHSHGAIVTAWPQIIHAWMTLGKVCRFRADVGPLAGRHRIFYSPFED